MEQKGNKPSFVMDVGATEFKPTFNKTEMNIEAEEFKPADVYKVNLNVKAEEFKPNKEMLAEYKKNGFEYTTTANLLLEFQGKENITDNEKKLINEEFDDFEFEEADDTLYPEYADCQCCKGRIMACDGQACFYLGKCYCAAKDDQQDK